MTMDLETTGENRISEAGSVSVECEIKKIVIDLKQYQAVALSLNRKV
jgi:hypothetical protein